MANLTISLDENIVKQARIKAIQEGTSLSAKVREFLAAYVQGEAKPQMVTQRVVLPVSSSKGGFLPGIEPTSNQSMLQAAEPDAPYYLP